MRRSAVFLFAAALALPCEPAHALRIRELASVGEDDGYEGGSAATIADLEGGGFVVAWTTYDRDSWIPRAIARIFDANGARVADVSCLDGSGPDGTYESSVAKIGGGFVFACETNDPHGPVWATTHVQRFSNAGVRIGEPLDFDSNLVNQLRSVRERDDDSYMLSLENCTNQACADTKSLQSANGSELAQFVVPRLSISELVPLSSGRLLAIGESQSSPSHRVSILVRRLGSSGETLDSVVKLARMRLDRFVQIVQGIEGRTAVSWSSTREISKVRTAYVRLLDDDGEPSAANAVIPLPRQKFASVGPIAALPLESGFVFVWTSDSETGAPPWYSYNQTFVQAYSESGSPAGERILLLPNASQIFAADFRAWDQSYLLAGIGARDWPDVDDALHIWRVGTEPRCGDIDDNESVDTSDAQTILRAAAGLDACDLCLCDVDGSGSIEPADAERALALATNQNDAGDCPVCPD